MYRVESAYRIDCTDYAAINGSMHVMRPFVFRVDQLGTTVLDMYLTRQTTTISTGVLCYP